MEIWTLFHAPLVSGSHLFGGCLARRVQENWSGLGDDYVTNLCIQRSWLDNGCTLTRQSTKLFPHFTYFPTCGWTLCVRNEA